jgi:hypothetical protein
LIGTPSSSRARGGAVVVVLTVVVVVEVVVGGASVVDELVVGVDAETSPTASAPMLESPVGLADDSVSSREDVPHADATKDARTTIARTSQRTRISPTLSEQRGRVVAGA